MAQEEQKKQYWLCLIGGIAPEKIGWGADFPLRMAVREKYGEMFGEDEDVCASGWGIDEERYNILRDLHMLPTADLKTFLDMHKEAQITTHE